MKKLLKQIQDKSSAKAYRRPPPSPALPAENPPDIDAPLCSTCLDLDWERYERYPEDKGDDFSERKLDVTLKDIRSSVDCRLCGAITYTVLEFGKLMTAATSEELLPDVTIGLSLWNTGKTVVKVRNSSDGIYSCIFSLDLYTPAGEKLHLHFTETNYSSVAGTLTNGPWHRVSSQLPSVLDVDTSARFITSHLDECNSSHGQCSRQKNVSMPSRLVFVPSNGDFSSIRLVDNPPHNANYVALSHCWGDPDMMYKTTASTLSARLDNIPWDDLPKTFQDAMNVLSRIGIEYMWVDSLCIVQDDEVDWKRESVTMANVYSQAYCTIAATCASNGQAGIFSPRRHITKRGAAVQYSCASTVSKDILSRFGFAARFSPSSHGQLLFHDPNVENAPLWLRAWAFQERALSNRTVHFHGEELIWECMENLSCECGHFAKHNSRRYLTWGTLGSVRKTTTGLISSQTGLPEIMAGWFGIVSAIRKLDITFESDRLPAISGIAMHMSKQHNSSYIAGIWGSELAQGLLWRTYVSARGSRVEQSPVSYVPTWSWASVKPYRPRCDIMISYMPNLLIDPYFRSPSFEGNSPVIKPVVTVADAAIQVHGKTIICSLRHCHQPDRHETLSVTYPQHELVFGEQSSYLALDVTCTVDKSKENITLPVLCLLVGISDLEYYPLWEHRYFFIPPYDVQYGLVLQGTSNGQYTRVGVFELDSRKDWFQYAEVQSVEII